MSFSQIIETCFGGYVGGRVAYQWGYAKSANQRLDNAMERFDQALSESKKVQRDVCLSNHLLRMSSTKVVDCLNCPKRIATGKYCPECQLEDLP